MKKVLLMTLVILLSLNVKSQTRELTGVKKVHLSNVQSIGSRYETKGYYAFYAMEKSDKGMVNYRLEILNDNLGSTHSIDIKKDKNIYLLEGKFNGTHFCFSFLNYKEKTLEFDIYDLNGKKTGSQSIKEVDQMYIMQLAQQLENEDSFYSGGLLEVPNQGFAYSYAQKGKGMKIFIDMIDNKGKKKWTLGSGVMEKSFEQFTFLYSNEENIFFTIASRSSAMTKEVDYNLIQVNTTTGKATSKNQFVDKNDFYLPFGVEYDEQKSEYIVYGEYYKKINGKASFKDKEGFFLKKLNKDGKEVYSKNISWEKDMSKKIKVGDKGKLEDGVAIFVHKIVKTDDGKYYAIAEQFNKVVSGLGVASAIMNGGNSSGVSLAKINILNMMVFELNSDFSLENVTIFEKNKTSVELPSGAEFLDENTLGLFVKIYGGFDYTYTSSNKANTNFQTTYVNYNRKNDKGDSKFNIGVISLNDAKKITDTKINLKSKPTRFSVMPSKPGYLVIFEYFKKEKRAAFRMEKTDI